MTRAEVVRYLDRLSAQDVAVVLGAFFEGAPPPEEILSVVQLVRHQAAAFDAALVRFAPHEPALPDPEPTDTESPAPVEPQTDEGG